MHEAYRADNSRTVRTLSSILDENEPSVVRELDVNLPLTSIVGILGVAVDTCTSDTMPLAADTYLKTVRIGMHENGR